MHTESCPRRRKLSTDSDANSTFNNTSVLEDDLAISSSTLGNIKSNTVLTLGILFSQSSFTFYAPVLTKEPVDQFHSKTFGQRRANKNSTARVEEIFYRSEIGEINLYR